MTLSVDDLIERKLVHEIHTSERKSYRACRRRWNWLFRESRYPYVTAKPLEFGSAYHLAQEVYYNPDMWNWPRDVVARYAIKVFVDKCEEQRKAFLEQTSVPYLEEEAQVDYDERVVLGQGMLKYYFFKIAPNIDAGWTPVKVEIAFMVAIPHPDTSETMWCKCDRCWEKWVKFKTKANHDYLTDFADKRDPLWIGLPVVYAGRCDMLAVDSNGDYWIFDWKTTARVNVDHDEFLELDDQVLSYIWALRKLGLPIRGFVYHEQKKAFPQPPNKNKVRRLGCIFSVSKSQDTDYETYLATIQQEDEEAYQLGYYDDFLDYLREEQIVYFRRWQIDKSPYQLQQAELNIGKEALEIIDPNLRIYPSPGRFGCTSCAFRQPCLEQNAGGDYQYALDTLYERREHYYVRNEPSTDSRGGL